ncbi:hypothetical protein KIPB_014594, partial [Kipferlia bialata]
HHKMRSYSLELRAKMFPRYALNPTTLMPLCIADDAPTPAEATGKRRLSAADLLSFQGDIENQSGPNPFAAASGMPGPETQGLNWLEGIVSGLGRSAKLGNMTPGEPRESSMHGRTLQRRPSDSGDGDSQTPPTTP